MDRLFWTIYAKILIGIALAAIVAVAGILPRVALRTQTNIEESMSGPVAVMTQMLADESARGGDIEASFARATPRFRMSARLISEKDPEFAALDAETRQRIARGEVVRTGGFLSSVVFAHVDGTDRLVRIGPVNMKHPLGEGRSLALLALLVAGLFLGVHLVLRPIRVGLAQLSNAATRIGAGDLTQRVDVVSSDALGRVGGAFNRMAEDVERTIAAQRDLLHMVSHDIRTPLQRMQFNVERLRTATDREAREIAIDGLDCDVEELDDFLAELLSFVRLGERRVPERAPVELDAVLEEICAAMDNGKVTLTFRQPRGRPNDDSRLRMSLDARLLRRAVSNLIANALSFARSRVEVSIEHDAATDHIRICVDDDGPGISPEERERIFEPFHSAAPDREADGKHFGLGLAIVRRIAQLHGGRVEALDSKLGGARFEIALPHVSPEPSRRG